MHRFRPRGGLSYRLVADCRTGTGTVVQRTLAQFYSRSVKVSTGVAGTYGNLRMQRQERRGVSSISSGIGPSTTVTSPRRGRRRWKLRSGVLPRP